MVTVATLSNSCIDKQIINQKYIFFKLTEYLSDFVQCHGGCSYATDERKGGVGFLSKFMVSLKSLTNRL